MPEVLVPIANGSEELEAVSIIDILRRAGASVTIASVHERQITASRGTKLVADKLISECVDNTYDLIALPGGMPGAEHLRDSEDLEKLLKRQQQEGRLYAAICASPVVVLHHHGLLAGRRATCAPGYGERLENLVSPKARVVVDGPCVTSVAAGTAIEFALKLVELLYDQEKARSLAQHIRFTQVPQEH
jgi:4-methyl-5(b-hydroxyethyl)-thiazole monophosphate biosynthesis